MSLLTVDDCLRRVPTATNADVQARLQGIIDSAESMVKHACGYALALTAYTEVHDIGRDQDTVVLAAAPVVIDSTHTFTLQTGTTSLTTWTRNTDYAVYTDTGIVVYLDGGVFEEGLRNMTVTYSAGYSATTFPDHLKEALLDLVGWRLERTGGAGMLTESMDGYSFTREPLVKGIPESIYYQLPVRGGIG
jgi:hypothetical protein